MCRGRFCRIASVEVSVPLVTVCRSFATWSRPWGTNLYLSTYKSTSVGAPKSHLRWHCPERSVSPINGEATELSDVTKASKWALDCASVPSAWRLWRPSASGVVAAIPAASTSTAAVVTCDGSEVMRATVFRGQAAKLARLSAIVALQVVKSGFMSNRWHKMYASVEVLVLARRATPV